MKIDKVSVFSLIVVAFVTFHNVTSACNKQSTLADKSQLVQSELETKQIATEYDRKPIEIKSLDLSLLELPKINEGELIVQHTGYTLSFNTTHNNPNWVAWELTAEETEGTLRRGNNFAPDEALPRNHQVLAFDYKESGFDRGHMCPAADNKWSIDAMNDCFLMSNMCPQNPTLNGGNWKDLEEACRRWAKRDGSVYIVCGPIYKENAEKNTIGREHTITVPDAFFKCVLMTVEGKEKAIGFYYENTSEKQYMPDAARTVDEIEAITGYDFFAGLDDELEERLESQCLFKKWQ